MKTTKTFENATLRTVNNGYIELDYNGKTQCFHNASVISVNNGSISIEVDWEPERGELIKIMGNCIDSYSIFDSLDESVMRTFGYKRIKGTDNKLQNDAWFIGATTKISPVTPEEQQAFDDFCKSQGKIWNKEKLQWEKYRWKPQYNDTYYYISVYSIPHVFSAHWINDLIDRDCYESNNCFKTKEEAEAKLKRIKKILAQ